MSAAAWLGGSRDSVRARRSTLSTSRSRRKGVVTIGRKPDQCSPPVGRVALPLEQALTFEVADDLADDRLSPAQVGGGLTDGEWPSHGQVLQDGARPGQLAARAVAAMKREVHGPEELGEPLGLRPLLRHATSVPAGISIVNPDGSPAAGPGRAAPRLGQAGRRYDV